MDGFWDAPVRRQASEQCITSSPFLAQDLRQLIKRPQRAQTLVGNWRLKPLSDLLAGAGGIFNPAVWAHSERIKRAYS